MELRGYRKNIIIFILTLILSMFVFSLVNTKEQVAAQSPSGCFSAMESLWDRAKPVGINSFDEYLAIGICTDNTNLEGPLRSCGCNDETVNGTLYDFNLYNDPTCNQASGAGPTLQRCRLDNGFVTPTSNLTPAQSSLNKKFRQIPLYGAMCQINYVDCSRLGPNWSNLFEDINNGTIKLHNITPESFAELFLTYEPLGYNKSDKHKICYQTNLYGQDIVLMNISEFITNSGAAQNKVQLSEGILNIGTDIATDLTANTYISVCPKGTIATRGINGFGIEIPFIPALGTQYPVACCPSGYAFVNAKNEANLGRTYVGACCRGNASEFDRGWYGSCTKKDGTEIKITAASNNYATFINALNKNLPLLEIYGAPNGSTSFIYGSGFSPKSSPGANMLYSGKAPAPNKVCPPNYPANSCVTSVNIDNDPNIYSKEFYDKQSDWECTKCYLPGEPIRIDQNTNKLHICDPTVTEAFTAIDLINNNVQDTLAFFQADELNRDSLKLCREQGGLYIAIGCVDPTPIGIITGAIRIAFGVLGGIALVEIILAGIAYQSGEEARIQAARNRIFATIGGISLLVFSVLVLRIIGVNVLDVVPSKFF